MFIKDGICYASPTSSGAAAPRITSAKALVGKMLLVTFETGEQRLFDATQLTEPAFEPLNDVQIFNKPSVQHGFISWDNGNIDLAPEYVYANSHQYAPSAVITTA